MSIFNIILFIHIVGGTMGLLAGTYITIAKKGDKYHKAIGKIFAVSMIGAGFCSLVLAILHRNNFLFSVGIFTIYMAGTGWRYIYLKNLAKGQKPLWIDWALMVFMGVGSVAFIKMGLESILHKEYFGFIVILFAWRGILLIIQDIKTFQGKIFIKNYWLVFHLQRMTSTYIASWTAFLVVNSTNKLSFLAWLLPTAIMVPLVIKWSKKYKVIIK